MDIFGRFARDPACLVAIDAADGGTWRSPFRPGVVYPSSVPRNFAADTAIWHDFVRAWNSYIITDDVSVKVKFRFNSLPTTIWAVFGIRGSVVNFVTADTNGGGRCLMGCAFFNVGRIIHNSFVPVLGQIYTAEFKKIGSVESVWLDGVQVATRTETISTAMPVPYYLNTPRTEFFDGNVLSVELKNLTTGKTVWQYPSFEERTRLITKANVWTENGVFEAADPAVAARIDTPLDLRGRVSSYTSVVRFTAANLTTDTTKQELAGQGSGIAVTERPAICAIAYHRTNATTYGVQINQEIGGARVAMSGAIAGQLSGMHVAVGVVEIRTTQTVLSVYLDGTLLKTQTYNGRPTGLAYSGFPNFSINDNRAGAWTNFFGKIHNVLLFDRALRQTEIQLLR